MLRKPGTKIRNIFKYSNRDMWYAYRSISIYMVGVPRLLLPYWISGRRCLRHDINCCAILMVKSVADNLELTGMLFLIRYTMFTCSIFVPVKSQRIESNFMFYFTMRTIENLIAFIQSIYNI